MLGRLPLVLEEDRFNNLEGAYEGEMFDFLQNKDNSLNTKEERQSAIFDNYRFTVQKLIDSHKRTIENPAKTKANIIAIEKEIEELNNSAKDIVERCLENMNSYSEFLGSFL